MQAFTSPAASCDDTEKRDLEYLLEVFSSMCSLKDIASAYCTAKHNVEVAAEMLCTSHTSSSDGATSSKLQFEDASAASSSDKILQKPLNGVGNTRASKSKKHSVSMGNVSGVIGKQYTRPRTSTNESIEMKKPLKLDLKEAPVSEIWSEEVQSTTPGQNSTMHSDAEEFLFKMLGEGNKLDMNVIQEVLGLCEYDVQKSMEKLLFMSASTLEKSDDVVCLSSLTSAEKCPDQHFAHSDESRYMIRNLVESPGEEKDEFVLQKEVLEALFHIPERSEEAPKRSSPAREVKRYKAPRKFVVKPLKPFIDTVVKTTALEPQEVTRAEVGDDEDSYEFLRKCVKAYWITMKEYYKDACDAFCEGDRVRGDKLLEKGHLFNRKAREADEKSSQKLLQVQNREADVSVDLQHHEPKEAIRLLRLQLTCLSGIPDFKYLRVIVGRKDEDITGRARRQLIIKKLEKESIKWTEEENGRTIVIRLDVIDPKSLSFSRKTSEKQ